MKTLELNQMEKLQGGNADPNPCAFAYLMGAIVIGAGIATGGIGLLIGFGGAAIMEGVGCN